MFMLTTVEDVIKIEPGDFTKPSGIALEDNINALYANKVIHKIGLCICFWDLVTASDGLVAPNKSDTVNVKVTFRLLIFRPFRGEILDAKIINSTKSGIYLQTEFFRNIFVAGPQNLFPNSHFSEEGDDDPVWIWEHESGPFYFDRNERVRFRVEEEIWTDLSPRDEEEIEAAARRIPIIRHKRQQLQIALVKKRSGTSTGAGSSKQTDQMSDERQITEAITENDIELKQTEAKARQRPWRLLGSMSTGGLGLSKWWSAEDDGS